MEDSETKPAVPCFPSDRIQPCSAVSEIKKEIEGIRKEFSSTKLDSKFKVDDYCQKRKKGIKNTKPERSRSGRMIKRKKFSSESEYSDYSEVEVIEEEKRKHSRVKDKSKSRTSESDSTEDRETRPSEKESSDADMKEELSQKIDKKASTNKKTLKSNGTNIKNKSKELKQTQQCKSQDESNKQLGKDANDNDVNSKLHNFLSQKTDMNFSNLGIQVSLNAVNEIKPDVLTTLKHCQKYSKNEFVRHKAKQLYNKFKNNFLDLEKICSSVCTEADGNFESITSDFNNEDEILPQFENETEDELKELDKMNLLTVNSMQQNDNKKNNNKKSKKGNSVAANHHKNINERLKNEKWGENINSSAKVTGDVIDLLSSNLAMMKSLESRKESMEDAFGNFVAHQLKTISDPVLKDRVMSRIMSLIMEEKYE